MTAVYTDRCRNCGTQLDERQWRDPDGPAPTNAADFRCECCGGVYIKAWTDEEAKEEADAYFPPEEEKATVCPDCYKTIMTRATKAGVVSWP